jgi:hypothetical protein
VTLARRNNLSVYSGVNTVIDSIVMPCSGQHTASGRLAILLVLLRLGTACDAGVDSSS